MHRPSLIVRLIQRVVLLGLPLAVVMALPAGGSTPHTTDLGRLLPSLSQSVQLRYWLANPDQAPPGLREQLRALRRSAAAGVTHAPGGLAPHGPGILGDVFNRDTTGLPQDEESVAVCHANPRVVLGATNDFRGVVLDPQHNLTGWHLSTDGGVTVANEGLLPALPIGANPGASSGDPVVAADGRCDLFAGSLNGVGEDLFALPDGVGVYRSAPGTLASCPGGSDPACWPTRRVVATATPGHILDKPWLDVGPSGAAGTVVWAVFNDLSLSPNGIEQGSLKAVRCDAALTRCTPPLLLSGSEPFAVEGDVTIGPDGRVYVTWSDVVGLSNPTPSAPHIIFKLRVAEPGQTTFGPDRVVAVEPLPAPPRLHADDFRIPPYGKNAVRIVGGRPRVFLTWEGCRAKATAADACEEPAIKLVHSDDLGATWSGVQVLSVGGDNYFPTIANDPAGPGLAVAWYTNRFDPQWHHRQDLELVTLNPASATPSKRQRVTATSNEPDADPVAGGVFIGDYIEVAAHGGVAYLHYTMNYRRETVLGAGLPVNQQDNYLSRRHL